MSNLLKCVHCNKIEDDHHDMDNSCPTGLPIYHKHKRFKAKPDKKSGAIDLRCANCNQQIGKHASMSHLCPTGNKYWRKTKFSIAKKSKKPILNILGHKLDKPTIVRRYLNLRCVICGATGGHHKLVGHYCPKLKGIARIGWLKTKFKAASKTGPEVGQELVKEVDKVLFPDRVNHPVHYGGDTTYETIKVLEAWLPREQFIGFLRGNDLKYESRAGKKGSAKEDHEKAQWYKNYLIDFLKRTQ
jgi:hypothetical protein